MASITITISDQRYCPVKVATDADHPAPGRAPTPAEILAGYLLQAAATSGATVIHDAQQVPLVAFALDIISPDMYGWAVSQEVRERAKSELGPRMGQLVPQRLTGGTQAQTACRKRHDGMPPAPPPSTSRPDALARRLLAEAEGTTGPEMAVWVNSGDLAKVLKHFQAAGATEAVAKRARDGHPIRPGDVAVSTVPHPDGPVTLAQLMREGGHPPPTCTGCSRCGGTPA